MLTLLPFAFQTCPTPNEYPQAKVEIDVSQTKGRLEWWRHTFGQGGINPIPLPQRAVEGIKKLRPRLIRIFIQEYFNLSPERGKFNWQILDPYMDALAQMGGKVVGCITIKPKHLFPRIDQRIWRPNDVKEWQRVIYELVHRYSVKKPLVTHWEIANEPDIGEAGGTPYLIPEVGEYCEFYRMTIEPILSAFPQAKVGGPALASVDSPLLEGLIQYCKETGTPLDFVSWHLYSDDPSQHARGIEKAKSLLEDFPGKKPEMLITEWNRNIADISGDFKDASIVCACLMAMQEAGVDWTFYYQIWDQVFFREQFESWFSPQGIQDMENFWGRLPRFGLFDLEGKARPNYFLYKMLYRMGEENLTVEREDPEVGLLASRSQDMFSLLVTNPSPQEKMLRIRMGNLRSGVKNLKIYRIGQGSSWELEFPPIEERKVESREELRLSLLSPAYSVAQIILEEAQ